MSLKKYTRAERNAYQEGLEKGKLDCERLLKRAQREEMKKVRRDG